MIHLTALGENALAGMGSIDGVTFTQVAVGVGRGPGTAADAEARVGLRAERARAAAGGQDTAGGRVGLIATFAAQDPGFAVTEIGVFARPANGGAEFLAWYGSVAQVGDAFGQVSSAAQYVQAVTLDVSSAAVPVNVTVSPQVVLAAVADATTERKGIVELAAVGAESRDATDATRVITPAGLATAVPAATTSERGVVELITPAEARAAMAAASPDAVRGVTAAALKSVLSLITVLHFAASNPRYVWNLPFSRALVVMKGGDGGASGGRGPARLNYDGSFSLGGLPAAGSNGGMSSIAGPGGQAASAQGGPGGPAQVSARFGWCASGNRLGSLLGPDGPGRGGRAGATGQGVNGGRGETVVMELRNLTPTSVLAIVVGGGGGGGAGGAGARFYSTEESPLDIGPAGPSGGSGDAGWVRIIPLPGAA